MEKVPLTIIGGGVIGLAIANELAPSKEVYLFEKNKNFGEEQSTRNSGVIHAGLYYQSEELKRRLCLEGNRLLYQFCQEYKVPCQKVGKLIVALDQEEDSVLEHLLKDGLKGGIELKKLSQKEVKNLEPNVVCYSALYSPNTGIIDSAEYVKRIASSARSKGANLFKGSKVRKVFPEKDCFVLEVETKDETYSFKTEFLINAAGLYADEIAKQINPDFGYEIVPVKGEYCKFIRRRPEIEVKTNVYPVPYKYEYQGIKSYHLGVHLTPLFEDKVINVGPAVRPVEKKDDYQQNIFALDDFYLEIKRFFPKIRKEDLELNYSGILAEIKDFRDFIIEKDKKYPHCLNLIGIESPGLTSSLAIAKYVKELL